MSFTTPESTLPAAAAAATSVPSASKGLMIATIILASLAAIGLLVALIFLFAAAANSSTEAFGWYIGFSVTASIVNVIPALAALVLGIIGIRSKTPASLTAIIVGASALVVLVGQAIFLLMV